MRDMPRYAYPLHLIPGFLPGILFGRRRSFRADALACLGGLKPPLQVFGEENIPRSGPCLFTPNHYHRPGFGAWWITLAIAARVPQEIHWTMTSELTSPGRWYGFLGRPASRWLLARLAGMYGFTSMPPMPPREEDVARRAAAVREVLAFTRRHSSAMLGLAPEGGDAPGGLLAWPPPGAGRFLLLLAGQGFPFVPVGCWEQEGRLCLRFGPAYPLQLPRGLAPGRRDRQAGEIVMRAIARQLPESLRGEFN